MTTSTLSAAQLTRIYLDTAPGLPKLPHIPENWNFQLTPQQQEENLLHVSLWIVERDLDNFDMANWHQAWGLLSYRTHLGKEITGKEAFGDCGTIHCIAGTAQVMAGEVGFSALPCRAGQRLLGDEAYSHFFDCNEQGLDFLKKVIARNS